jgi:ribonuclease P protein component
MLPKHDRIKETQAFQEVFRRGKPFFFGGIGCKALSGKDKTRIGFAISRKIYPRAVDRNRAKRLLAEAIRAHRNELPTDTHLVFFLGKRPEALSLTAFERAVCMILRNMR